MKNIPQELLDWINSNDCECEDDFQSFKNCCGKSLNIFEQLEELCSKERLRPRFKDLSLEEQSEILELIR